MTSSPSLDRERWVIASQFTTFGLIVGVFTANIPYIQAAHAFDLTDIGHLILSINFANLIGIFIGRRKALTARALFKIMNAALIIGVIGTGLATNKLQCITAGLVLGTGSGLLAMFGNASAALIESRYRVSVLPRMHAEFSKGVLLGALAGLLGAFGEVPYVYGFLGLSAPILAGAWRVLATPSVLTFSDADRLEPARSKRTGHHRSLAILGTVAFICIVVEGAIMGWSGILLSEGLQVPEALLPLGVLAFTLCSFLVRHHGERVIAACGGKASALAGSLLTAAVLTATLGFLSNVWLGLVAVAVVGMGTALVIPIVFSLAGNLVAHDKGQLISDVSVIGYAASIIGPSVVAFFGTRYGIKASLSYLAFGLTAAWLVVAVSRSALNGADTLPTGAGRGG